MNIAPPPIPLYDRPGVMAFWREIMHRYEEYANSPETRAVCARVFSDARRVADPLLCTVCSTPTVNVAEGTMINLKCPNCGAEPVEVLQYAAEWYAAGL